MIVLIAAVILLAVAVTWLALLTGSLIRRVSELERRGEDALGNPARPSNKKQRMTMWD